MTAGGSSTAHVLPTVSREAKPALLRCFDNLEAINRANPAVAKPSRAACALRGAEARIIRTRRGERWPATPAAFLLRLAEPRSIVVLARDQRSSYEDRPSGRWPAIYLRIIRTKLSVSSIRMP